MLYDKSDCIDRSTKHVCSWERALFNDITLYKANIDSTLESCMYDYDVIYNNNNHHLYSHKQLHVHGTYKALCTKLQLH